MAPTHRTSQCTMAMSPIRTITNDITSISSSDSQVLFTDKWHGIMLLVLITVVYAYNCCIWPHSAPWLCHQLEPSQMTSPQFWLGSSSDSQVLFTDKWHGIMLCHQMTWYKAMSPIRTITNDITSILCMRGQGLGMRLWVGVVRHILGPSCLMPRPHFSWGKGSGDYWAISWLCWINSIDFGQANEIVPHIPSMCISQWNRPYIIQACNQCLFKINTAHSADSEHQNQLSPDPFPHERWGLGTRLGTIVPRLSPTPFPWLHTWPLNPRFSGFPVLQSPKFMCIALSG